MAIPINAFTPPQHWLISNKFSILNIDKAPIEEYAEKLEEGEAFKEEKDNGIDASKVKLE